MQKNKHLFFDIDKTLWDFKSNTEETFRDIYIFFHLKDYGIISSDLFLKKYESHNERLWDLYRKGLAEKEFISKERFRLTLNDFGIADDDLCLKLSKKYIEISPQKTRLFPGTIETLDFLSSKFPMHIITNGFNEVQFRKLELSGISEYFQTVTTSEEAGCHKPDRRIFDLALKKAQVTAAESIMIGDDLAVDIIGAKDAGMDQVFLNLENAETDGNATFEIKSIEELKIIFS